MKLFVKIEYWTNCGEQVFFCLGDNLVPLAYSGDGIWSGYILSYRSGEEYTYRIMKNGHCVRKEWRGHSVTVPAFCTSKTINVYDRWNDLPANAPLYSSAFTKAIFRRKGNTGSRLSEGNNIIFRTACPDIRPDEILAITGNTPELGNWERPVPMSDLEFPFWTAGITADRQFEYKYVIVRKDDGTVTDTWEDGGNRLCNILPKDEQINLICTDEPRFAHRPWKGAGTAIPVFSLRSEESFGIGDFNDLKILADWCSQTGQKIIQLLPVNDTTMTGTWMDSYPYNANSSFALHPQFLYLPAAGVSRTQEYKKLQQELNSLSEINYERVNTEKTRLLRKAYESNYAKLGTKKDFTDFVNENEFWLLPYSVFRVLAEDFGTSDFSAWDKYAEYDRDELTAFIDSRKADIHFHYFLQYHLHLQLKEACRHAHESGIAIKGDLPIGVSRTSADAWQNPEIFKMESQAGAPPDAFSENGQTWGFPTYNWENMAKDDYAWWKSRLGHMAKYFDAFRIDHILGFFRIWEMDRNASDGLSGHFCPALPYSVQELAEQGFGTDKELFIEDPYRKGYYHPHIASRNSVPYENLSEEKKKRFDGIYYDFFYHRHNDFWKESALEKLPALLSASDMLACGEDLGMIPSCVPEVMGQLRILSLEIQRMPKSSDMEFADTEKYPYLSVCSTSTHDMNPIRAWWKEDKETTSRFYHSILRRQGEAPADCEPGICRQIIEMNLESPSMFAIFPIQDWMAIDGKLRYGNPEKERINVPAVSRYYWRYRMHICLEDLLVQTGYNNEVKSLIVHSGRR